MLEVTGAEVRYGQRSVLRDVDLTVAADEVVAVLGPSGGGKSTLLRAVAGLEPLVAGRVHLEGRDVTDLPPDRRQVGLAFQDAALFPHRTVAENVAFGPRMRGWSRADTAARVAQVLALVDLADAGPRRVTELSGGEAQRTALARAVAARPPLLLLDEPLGALDRALRDRLLGDLPDVFADAGAAVLYVTHDHEEALALADRVGVLVDGRLRQLDAPAALWRDPADTAVADVLGLDARLPARRVTGGVATALGTWPLAVPPGGADLEVALLPGAITLDGDRDPRRDGPSVTSSVTGRVTGRRFAVDHVALEVALAVAGGPTVRLRGGADAPPVGATVDLTVHTSQVRVVPVATPPPGATADGR